MPSTHTSLKECIDAVVAHVGKRIVVSAPIGAGKSNHILNELYRRAVEDESISLTIVGGLSIELPKGKSDLERRFLEPFVQRVFGSYPDLEYVGPYDQNRLPANVEVVEFYLRPGASLGNPAAQHNYLSSNYTHVARDMMAQGVNVFTQAIAKRTTNGQDTYSLSSNADSLDFYPLLREKARQGHRVAAIGQVNRELPFMLNDAEVSADTFDFILDEPCYDHTVLASPNTPMATTDHAIGLNASTLVRDAGTLQIGIGSLGDAIASACCVRQEANNDYVGAVDALGIRDGFGDIVEQIGDTAPFQAGLYGASEMVTEGFRQLIEHGILKRAVYDDAAIQALVNEGWFDDGVPKGVLTELMARGVIDSRLGRGGFDYLQRYGILEASVQWSEPNGLRTSDGGEIEVDLFDARCIDEIAQRCLGGELRRGVVLHGGFFLGPEALYDGLRTMDDTQRARIGMTGIGFVNQLYGHQTLAELQRQRARFINTTMMVTLSGAACSDGLESGQVVSGVGGQYNFVAMAHELADARSVLMLRSTRTKDGEVSSNIVSSYGHLTIPRHLRDVIVTEYGIADLRSKRDHEVIAALLNITDSRFQGSLLAGVKRNGKIADSHVIPDRYRNNCPERLEKALSPYRAKGLFGTFPFGTDFTEVELALGKVLKGLKAKLSNKLELTGTLLGVVRAPSDVPAAARPYLERLALEEPKGLKETMLQRLILSELIAAGLV